MGVGRGESLPGDRVPQPPVVRALYRYFIYIWIFYNVCMFLLSIKVDCLLNAVGKQPSIALINLGREWMLS